MATTRKPLYDPDEATARDGAPLPVTEPGEAELDAVPAAPPEADVVAGRALMVAALMDRARLESSRDAKAHAALSSWVETHGLFGHLGAEGAELFDSPLGSWSDDDVDAVGWTAEELHLLLWALGKVDFPGLEESGDAEVLRAKVPVLGDADGFQDTATLRGLDELEEKRVFYDALNEAVRSEVYARSLQEDPDSLEEDDELEVLLESVAAEGFDREAAAAQGKAQEAIGGLRYWARTLLKELFAAGSPHAAQAIDSAKLVSLDDAALATLLGRVHARAEALAWLLEGDEFEDDEDAPPDDEA